ncbi:hypothetical protein [Kineococcus sp. SYSU DK003]|uniref:hypothetical protein n=1 Tax=Kineococcus sp. SYSU DK003 TaxID=3383124 RepID=UPI003D7CF4F3
MPTPALPPCAVITAGSLRQTLAPGDTLTFGRGAGHDLRIGHEPEDLRVPRAAGRLECRADGVLVHNTSDKRSISARTFPGPGFEIAPGALVGTVPYDMVQLVIQGQTGNQYAINIDTRGLVASIPPPQPERSGSDGSRPTVGFVRIDGLRLRERHLLLALCLPAWSGRRGAEEVPSYAEMESIFRERGVAVSAGRLRKDLDLLRRKLSEEHQVENVYTAEPGGVPAGGKQSFLPGLARWARTSGNVTEAELERFEDGDLAPG